MLKPFYQGKLDTFCAIYAVLNALRLTHGIRSLKGREILNDTLLYLTAIPGAFRDVLNQDTDYIKLVDHMLAEIKKKTPLEVVQPFSDAGNFSPEDVWQACSRWLNGGDKRAVIFRFFKYLKPDEKPLNRHWTTADKIDGKVLHLFDCSHEAEAILNIRRESYVTSPELVTRDKLIMIQPDSLRCVRLPF